MSEWQEVTLLNAYIVIVNRSSRELDEAVKAISTPSTAQKILHFPDDVFHHQNVIQSLIPLSY